MCGICAGIGSKNQIEIVLKSLKKLEYRGYDSSGIAYQDNEKIKLVRSVGEIKNLENKIDKNIFANLAISHTRWATHGGVTEENAHPHLSSNFEFAMVHNGIVENFEELKNLYLQDIKLNSQTDTEVFVNLIEKQNGKILSKLTKACSLVKGSFAVALLNKIDNKIFLAKRNSPLMVGKNENGCLAGSDMSIFDKTFKDCYILEDDEFAVLSANKIEFFDKEQNKIEKKAISLEDVDFCEDCLNEKHFMLKEIKEQPLILRKTLFNFHQEIGFEKLNFDEIRKYKSFHFIACGTAYHSALQGAKFVKKFCLKDCRCSIASEFRYDCNIFDSKCLYVFVSQSGETADTIACAKLLKERGRKILCVTNVPYCSLNKISDYVLPTFAGKEIAVASTKAYTAQVFTMLMFALKLSKKLEYEDDISRFVKSFVIEDFSENLLEYVCKFKKLFFIGREQDYITSLESALKLKEIAYINCIGIAGGELKHGTLALVDESTLVVVVSTQHTMKEKIESNIQEIKARGGKILLVTNFEHNVSVDFQIKLQDYAEFLMPILSIIPLQLLAYHYSVKLGFNPDKPRNLAKSVTVE